MHEDLLNQLLSCFEIDFVIQFGNLGRNANDIDLLIVSDSFIGISNFKRRQMVRNINYSFDALCLTNSQFTKIKTCDSMLYKSILTNYKLLYGHHSSLS